MDHLKWLVGYHVEEQNQDQNKPVDGDDVDDDDALLQLQQSIIEHKNDHDHDSYDDDNDGDNDDDDTPAASDDDDRQEQDEWLVVLDAEESVSEEVMLIDFNELMQLSTTSRAKQNITPTRSLPSPFEDSLIENPLIKRSRKKVYKLRGSMSYATAAKPTPQQMLDLAKLQREEEANRRQRSANRYPQYISRGFTRQHPTVYINNTTTSNNCCEEDDDSDHYSDHYYDDDYSDDDRDDDGGDADKGKHEQQQQQQQPLQRWVSASRIQPPVDNTLARTQIYAEYGKFDFYDWCGGSRVSNRYFSRNHRAKHFVTF